MFLCPEHGYMQLKSFLKAIKLLDSCIWSSLFCFLATPRVLSQLQRKHEDPFSIIFDPLQEIDEAPGIRIRSLLEHIGLARVNRLILILDVSPQPCLAGCPLPTPSSWAGRWGCMWLVHTILSSTVRSHVGKVCEWDLMQCQWIGHPTSWEAKIYTIVSEGESKLTCTTSQMEPVCQHGWWPSIKYCVAWRTCGSCLVGVWSNEHSQWKSFVDTYSVVI